MATRRLVFIFLLLGLASQGVPAAFAKDGDGGGDGGGGGDDGGGDDDGGDDGNSGSGDDDDNGNSGRGGGNSRKNGDDRKIRQAVRNGMAQPLRNILSKIRGRFQGEVVRIRLTGTGSKMVYRIRIINRENKLIEVRVNAGTGRIIESSGVN